MKTILVSLNNLDLIKSQMHAATEIAHIFKSHILGLYVLPSVWTYTAKDGATKVENAFKDDITEKAKQSKKLFDEIIVESNLSGEWMQIESNDHLIYDSVIQYGRQADLTILGSELSSSRFNSSVDMNATIVHSLGRPALIVPKSNNSKLDFEIAIITWDGSKESARAAFDALPILEMAKQVKILTINPEKELGSAGDVSESELVNALSRHNLNITCETLTTQEKTGAVILERAKHADLLVMGAYGHSRIRETVLGGVTDSILKNAPCAVLMSN